MKPLAKGSIGARACLLPIFCAALILVALDAMGEGHRKGSTSGEVQKGHSRAPAHELVLRGAAALQLGEVEEAEHFLGEALKIDKMNGEAMNLLGKLNFLKRRHDAAEQYLLGALKVARNDVAAHLLLGKVKLAQKKKAEAFEHFQEASELEPQNAEAKLLLGYLRDDKGLIKTKSADLAELAYSTSITRGEFAKLLMSELPQVRSFERGAGVPVLSDVVGTGLEEVISEVVVRGLIAPYANSTFAPYAPLKWGEMALAIETMLAKAGLKIDELRLGAAPKGDYKIDEFNLYHRAAVLLSLLGIIDQAGEVGRSSISGAVSGQDALLALERLGQYLTSKGLADGQGTRVQSSEGNLIIQGQ